MSAAVQLTERQRMDAAIVQSMGYGCGFTVERSDADILAERAAERAEGLAAEDYPLCRMLFIVGEVRHVFEAFCRLDNEYIVEPVLERALRDGVPTVLRPITCKDPEHGASRFEHNLHWYDGRDEDVRIPHYSYSCSWCGRCEVAEADFDVEPCEVLR